MKIGALDLGPQPVLLAPMEDVTDIGFRLLCRQMSAVMVYTEFVSSDALVRNVNRTIQKLQVCPEERPVAIQIYGKYPDAMAEAARMVVDMAHPDVLDLNFGCPVKRVASKGAGAGLLRDIPLMLDITRRVVDAVDIPVVGIGGLNVQTIPQIKGCGADGAAVVSAIFAADDCLQATRDLRAVCERTFR